MKYYWILVLCLLFSIQTWGQESVVLSKITLNTGTEYIGEIMVQTADMVMIKTSDGKRYQFPTSEIKTIQKALPTDVPRINKLVMVESPTEFSGGNMSGMLEIAGGISGSKYSFTSSPCGQVSLAFGNKKAFGKDVFLGAGLGYNVIWDDVNKQAILLIPVFARLQYVLTTDKTAPFVGFDAGYAFSGSKNYGGGTFARISTGIVRQMNYKTSVSLGAYAALNSISSPGLHETTELESFSYNGNVTIASVGLKVGLQF